MTRAGEVGAVRGGVGAAAVTRAGEVGAVRGGVGAAAVTRLVVGVGCSLGCADEELGALVDAALAKTRGTVVGVATVDRRAHEPCVVALAAQLAVPLRTFEPAALAAIDVPTPSRVVARHVGTPSVAEAAALLATRGELVVTKRRSPHATCAIAKEH